MRTLSAILLLAAAVGARPVAAQTRFEAAYGPWWPRGDSGARVFHAGIGQPLGRLAGVGFTFVHVADPRSPADRTLSGGEFSLRVGAQGTGFYALGGVGVGVRHAGGTDAFWSAGGGASLRIVSSLLLGVEARYRVEDSEFGGFWKLTPADGKGFLVMGRLAFGIPRGRSVGAAPASPNGPAGAGPASAGLPPPGEPYDAARAAGASEEAARLTASVVETALAEMGAPYRWGGSDQNGWDCSGLIQYAYGQHGIVLPRVSRDQMRMGAAVDPDAALLRPGDILGFSAERSSTITHVGLYVGSGQFIHSASTGVKLSSLLTGDGDSRWWRERWVGVRRIVE